MRRYVLIIYYSILEVRSTVVLITLFSSFCSFYFFTFAGAKVSETKNHADNSGSKLTILGAFLVH